MPFKKNYKKKNYRKRYHRNKAKMGKPSKGLRQSVYLFKRRTVQVVNLNTQNPPEDWEVGSFNSLYKQTTYSLDDIRDQTDFTNLFSMYKLSAVSLKFMFSNTGSVPTGTTNNISSPPQTYSNSQILVMYAPWRAGSTEATDANYMRDCQASKRRLGLNGGKPIKMYMPLRQLTMVYRSLTDTDYTSSKPRWISTAESSTPHYGVSICFQKADQGQFASDSTNYQSCRIEATYYIACKGVV